MTSTVPKSATAFVLAVLASTPVFAFTEQPLPVFASGSGFEPGARAEGFSTRDFPLFAPQFFGITSLSPLSQQQSFQSRMPLQGTKFSLGVQTTSGFVSGLSMPGGFSPGISRGLEYSSTQVKLDYNMGRLSPFITAGASSIRSASPALNFPGLNIPASAGLTSGPGPGNAPSKSFVNVGAGFNYAVSNQLTIGIAASVGSLQNNAGQ